MKKHVWKQAVSLFLALLMVLTAVPVTAQAEGETTERLVNIAGEATVSIGGTENSANPVAQVNDGDRGTTAGLHYGSVSEYKSAHTDAAVHYQAPYVQLDFTEAKENIKQIIVATLKADNAAQKDLYQYDCTVYGKAGAAEEYTQLGMGILKRSDTQENSMLTLDLAAAPKTLQSVVVTLDLPEGITDSWPILQEVEIYQGQTGTQEPDPQPADGLENIAADCTIAVPSAQQPAGNMVDGNASTMWVNNGASWPCTAEFALPAANTKCVKKVVLKFEHQTNRSMDVSLQYALNGVTSDLISVEGSQKTAVLSDGYTFEFQTPQAMSHLYVTLDNPLTGGAAGQFWPAIAEAEIYIDNGAEEEVVLENIAATRKSRVTLEDSVNTETNQKNVTDNDTNTSAPLQTKPLAELEDSGTLPFVEVGFGINQKIRQFVLEMAEDATGAQYRYTLYGKKQKDTAYTEITAGNIGTASGNKRTEVAVSSLEGLNVKEVEYESIKVAFEAANDEAKATVPRLAEFQALANQATISEADRENIVWGTTAIRSSCSQDTVNRVVDGNTNNTWTADRYPAYVDIDLEGEYDLSKIEVFTPQNGYSQYSLYYSNDGQNYTKIGEKTSKDSCGPDGETWETNVTASSLRILLEYHSENSKAVLNEVRVIGKYKGEATKAEFKEPADYSSYDYDAVVKPEDAIEEVQGIVRRNLGEAYTGWFEFVPGEKAAHDYFELEDTADGKVRITGNDGVSMAMGLNHYLKYFCNVSITQVGNQVKMPAAVVPVGDKVHKECKVPVRYAYNYCTMSYSMPFWGKDEWRKELDWLALNGVNTVLDTTGQEEVWRRFLKKIGYDHAEIKDYLAGPAFYAWAYMANLSGWGGPVHDSWFTERTELARENQLSMRKLGMKPILQAYSGMVPVDIAAKAKGAYALESSNVIAQGNWCGFQRPYMLRTTSDSYKAYAELFYQCQKEVYGNVTNYYATDPFHEGGNTGGMNAADVSSHVLDELLIADEKAVWVIQAWQGNPSAALVNGLGDRKEHALILDLYAEKNPHWDDSNYAGGKEFQETPWVYCMLNNFGGRMGLHGHMDNLVNGVAKAANEAKKLTGIGITPEASQNNPVLYDLLFETVWCDDADQPLEKINTAEWLKKYVTRRYGAESENAYQAMRILENTVYKASLNMRGQGAPESYINARPATRIGAASTWGNAVIGYDMAELEKAADLLLKDYDKLAASDAYLYDVADVLKQVLANTAQSYHAAMVSALNSGNLEKFTETSDKFLELIDMVEKVLGTRKEFLLGTWVEQAKALAVNADDFSKDLYEFNAKAIITTWGTYENTEGGGLRDYSNRQWAGLTKDFYRQRWSMWIEQKKAELAGESAETINWFEFEWAWARANTEYTTETSGADLKSLGRKILRNYTSGGAASSDVDDYPVEKITLSEIGSEETSREESGAVNVLDGNRNTIWHTNYSGNIDNTSYANHYLVFELEEETELGGLRYLPRQDNNSNGIITGYQIYVSSNGTDYEPAAEGSWAADNSWKLASFEKPMMAKYVKFVTTASNGGFFSSAAEIRLTVPSILVTEIQVKAEKTELKPGETLQLDAEVLPEDASDSSVFWSSGAPAVAEVDDDGLVTAKAKGTVMITAEAADGSGVKGQICLTVVEEKKPQEEAKSDLQQAIKISTEGRQETAYTAASWKAYADALAKAQELLADPNATLEQITAAKEELKKAEAALVKTDQKPSVTEPGQKPSVTEPGQKPVTALPKVGTVHKTKTLVFKITASNDRKKTVAVQKPVSKKAKKITIPATVTIDGYTYKVTEIVPKAFRKNNKLAQVLVGTNIQKIGKQAFDGCRKLKKVTVKAKALKNVGKYAFRGISKKARILVPKKKYKKYAKALKKAGTGKTVKIIKR